MNNEKNPKLFFFRCCLGIGSSGRNRNAPTAANETKESQKSALPTTSLTEVNRIIEIGIRKSRGGRIPALRRLETMNIDSQESKITSATSSINENSRLSSSHLKDEWSIHGTE
jgi:hypothetical protein